MHEDHDQEEEDGGWTVVMESYMVDVPADSCKKDTCLFADTIVRCNLKALARVAKVMCCDQVVLVPRIITNLILLISDELISTITLFLPNNDIPTFKITSQTTLRH